MQILRREIVKPGQGQFSRVRQFLPLQNKIVCESVCISCNTGKIAFPDMYARHPRAQRPRASVDISDNLRFPVLQLICKTSSEADVFIC